VSLVMPLCLHGGSPLFVSFSFGRWVGSMSISLDYLEGDCRLDGLVACNGSKCVLATHRLGDATPEKYLML
jgi:hypothetical protein